MSHVVSAALLFYSRLSMLLLLRSLYRDRVPRLGSSYVAIKFRLLMATHVCLREDTTEPEWADTDALLLLLPLNWLKANRLFSYGRRFHLSLISNLAPFTNVRPVSFSCVLRPFLLRSILKESCTNLSDHRYYFANVAHLSAQTSI